MMDTLTLATIGICAGLLLALFGNVVVLPFVLRWQSEWLRSGRRGWDRERAAATTTLAYRFLMPLVFAIVGADAAVSIFGEVQ
ncbi:MAG: hypothetical protein ACTHJQ_07350 [Rhizobiaceae bacterium]